VASRPTVGVGQMSPIRPTVGRLASHGDSANQHANSVCI